MAPKVKALTLLLALTTFISCKTSQFMPEAGLYKISVLYPNGDDKNFDMDYYEKVHMPMVAGFIGKNLKFYEIDKGISGRTPDDKAPFVAIGSFYVRNITEYHQAIAKNRDAIVNDFKKYTNIMPVVQVNEIKTLANNRKK